VLGKGGERDALIPAFILSKTFFFSERTYYEDYFYVKISFAISLHVELCVLKIRERQSIMF
jgi:hypothetical protein